MKILIAEDDPAARLIVRKSLEDAGHDCIAFEDGLEAWMYYAEHSAQLIVTDWMMPEMDGLELCRRVRDSWAQSYTYILILTALSGREKLMEALEAGADDFMTKPVDVPQLVARIKVAQRIQGLHAEVSTLQGLLSVCSYCKKIREEREPGAESWTPMEQYVAQRTEASFSHGVCPTCYETRILPQIEALPQR